MKNLNLNYVFLLVYLSVYGPAFGAPKSSGRDEIKTKLEECQAVEKNKASRHFIFINKASYEEPKKWKAVKSFDDDKEFYGSVELFFDTEKHLRLGKENGGSESGDHSYNVSYCFRQDGTLAFVFREFETFQGNGREERRIWISQDHKKIGDELKFFDLETKKELKEAKFFRPENFGWKIFPDQMERYTAKKYLSQYPKVDLTK